MLACTLGAPAPTPEGQGANILTLAAQTLQAQTPTADQGISVDQALTLAVGTLQAEATATDTIVPSNPPVIQPTNKPKKTKTPKPSNTPVSPTVVPTTGTLHIHFPPIVNLTLDCSYSSGARKPQVGLYR